MPPEQPLSVEDYHVGWICVLADELAAARTLFDEVHDDVEADLGRDDNTYVLGRMHDHYVVMTCLPAGRYGAVDAAVVATNMRQSFPCLRFALMVGIGGGVPNIDRHWDIRLGDVVVSQPDEIHPGVVQYDLGKSLTEGKLKRTGHLSPPPTMLLTALSDLQSRHRISGNQITSIIVVMRKRLMGKDHYGIRPDRSEDRLYCSMADTHQNGQGCEKCFNGFIMRETRQTDEPMVHYGTVVSGNQVIKDAIKRDWLGQELGAKCVEMEAAGIMNVIPSLVIRGISDYADSYKNDIWREYASATAAAFANEVLKVVKSVHVEPTLRTSSRNFHSILQKIPYVRGAQFDSYGLEHDTCHPDTRQVVLRQIQAWAGQMDGKHIFWLCGMAGTGKSTIARTIAKWLDGGSNQYKVKLGANFFFKRGEDDRGSAIQLFPTIVRQLARAIPALVPLVANAINSDPNVFEKLLGEQFDKLIKNPLQQLKASLLTERTHVIVIDALDECENEEDIRVIIRLFSQLLTVATINLKLLITSRPELPIQLEFRDIADLHNNMILHNVPQTDIRHDIRVYISSALSKTRKRYNQTPSVGRSLDPDWPSHSVVERLVEMSVPLFIVAATMCRFIDSPLWPPQEQLQKLLTLSKTGQLTNMERTYLQVLQQAFMRPNAEDSEEAGKLYEEFRSIVGSIVILGAPLSMTSLSILLDIPHEVIMTRLTPLGSVLHIPLDPGLVLRPLHLSFYECLTSPNLRKTPFGIDPPALHHLLFVRCLHVLSDEIYGVRENICNLDYPGFPRSDINQIVIQDCIPPTLEYACRYWVYHFQQSGIQSHDHDRMYTFLSQHFLHWFEALSLLGRSTAIVGYISVLRATLIPQENSSLEAFLKDAGRFVLAHRYIIDLTPLQLYSSAIMFTPQSSPIRNICGHVPKWITKFPLMAEQWNSRLQKFMGGQDFVGAMAFSHDSKLLFTASNDRTIRIWEVSTGQELRKLEGHSARVTSLALPHHNDILVTASRDQTVRIWEIDTGRTIQELDTSTLGGGMNNGDCVAISRDGMFIASGSEFVRVWKRDDTTYVTNFEHKSHYDFVRKVSFLTADTLLAVCTLFSPVICLLDVFTGLEVRRLDTGLSIGSKFAFTSDGDLLASFGTGSTIHICEVRTGQEVRNFENQTGQVSSIAFSHDDGLLATGSNDRSARVFDLRTGQITKRFDDHTGGVMEVAFSHDSKLLATLCEDWTVSLWDTNAAGTVESVAKDSDRITTVRFSSDGRLLASGSLRPVVLLWDTWTGQVLREFKGHSAAIAFVSFSPDNQQLASASDDHTVCVWNTRTGQVMLKLVGHKDAVQEVEFSSSGTITSVSNMGGVLTWDVATGQPIHDFGLNTIAFMLAAFSYDGEIIALMTDFTIHVWDTLTGQQLQLIHHASKVGMAFADDGRTLMFDDKHIVIDRPRPITSAFGTPESEFALSYDWVERNGRNWLWIPDDYRLPMSNACGNVVAIRRPSARVSFIHFNDGTGRTQFRSVEQVVPIKVDAVKHSTRKNFVKKLVKVSRPYKLPPKSSR